MKTSSYYYNLITTKKGLVPIEEIEEGTEVLSMGKWVVSPKPTIGTVIQCTFDTLPATSFNKKDVSFKREVSICHNILLNKGDDKKELSIRGFFKEDKNTKQTTFKGLDDMLYWLPRFIKYYDEPMLPFVTALGFNLYHHKMPPHPLSTNEITERNLEYILEGMNRRTFSYSNGKYNIMPITSWNETHRLTMRLLDIECDVHKDNTVVRNVVNFYRHIRDEYTKNKIKEEDIVFNLKRSNTLPLYTNGHKILHKEEMEGVVLEGINPDINTINPSNCYESGFTMMENIYSEQYTKEAYDSRWKVEVKPKLRQDYLKDNFFSQFTK